MTEKRVKRGKVNDKYARRCLMRLTTFATIPSKFRHSELPCRTAGRAQTNFRLGNRSTLLSSPSPAGMYPHHRVCRVRR